LISANEAKRKFERRKEMTAVRALVGLRELPNQRGYWVRCARVPRGRDEIGDCSSLNPGIGRYLRFNLQEMLE
jgi:hypothetical protein